MGGFSPYGPYAQGYRPPADTPPGMQPVPGMPGYYYIPGTNYVVQVTPPDPNDAYGKPTYNELPLSVGKSLLGSAGVPDSTGSAGTRLTTDDPRYWDLQYRQLDDQAKQAADQLAANYVNMGLDAESARRQALATLIESRNAQQVNLAQTSAGIAAQAAQFAANPRDAVAELNYRNAVGGATPFGSTQNANFPQYTTSLQDKFKELFGNVGGDLSRAREFLMSPPPAEFLQPSVTGPAAAGINQNTTLPPAPNLAPAGGGAAGAPNPLASLMGATPEQEAYYRQVEGNRQMASATPDQAAAIQQIARDRQPKPYAEGGTLNALPNAPQLAQGYVPPSSEGGTNMNIHEPFLIMGAHSGHVYATGSEHAPEQVFIKPLPSVQRSQKEFMKSTQGAKRNDQGGSVTQMPDASDFIAQLRQQLSGLGGQNGGVGGFNGKLPDIRLLAGAPAQRLAQDPVLNDYTMAGYSSMGIDPRTVQSTIDTFTPRGPIGNLPRISWA